MHNKTFNMLYKSYNIHNNDKLNVHHKSLNMHNNI
jgi:hypothetical protein